MGLGGGQRLRVDVRAEDSTEEVGDDSRWLRRFLVMWQRRQNGGLWRWLLAGVER